MKKFLYPSLTVLLGAAIFIIVSCEKKGPNSDQAIAGSYKDKSTGTAANPNIGVVMVTGTATLTNPATQNSAIQIGGAGWSNPTCVSSGSLILSGYNGGITANLFFAGIPSAGTYSLSGSGGLPRLEITNAPGQPDGIVWYSKSGSVTVTTTTAQINAVFNNVQCLQKKYLFPVVAASGTLTCGG